jgi:uncharacterized protein (TIGR03435 family)
MKEHLALKSDYSRIRLLGGAGFLAVAIPTVFGLLNATQTRAESQVQSIAGAAPVYEVASIKPDKSDGGMVGIRFRPDGFSATNATLQMLIRASYGVEDNQILGAPNWLTSEKYDIEAKMETSAANELRKLSPDQRKIEQERMLQTLLADRFKLTLHRGTKGLSVYALVIAKNGPKLQESKPGDTYPNGSKGPDGLPLGAHMMRTVRGQIKGQALPMASFVRVLSRQLGRTVLDKTGLTGTYDFTLQWTQDESQAPLFKGTEDGQQATGSTPPLDSNGPSIFTAIQEQLGLKLESQKGLGEILVIDHVEKPSEN